MVCIYCHEKTAVTNSRTHKKTTRTWRRRECTVCYAIFTTYESPDFSAALRVKTLDGKLEPLQRDLLLVSIFPSLSHRKNAQKDASGLTDTILSEVLLIQKQGVVSSSDLKEIAIKILERFDNVAASHYAAHYR